MASQKDKFIKAGTLQVSALWHEQVHQSRVTSISVSRDGSTLYCGCDAAVPKLDEVREPAVVAVAATDGQRVRDYDTALPINVRHIILRFPGDSQLLCIGSHGSLATFDDATGSLQEQAALPGMSAAMPPPTPDADVSVRGSEETSATLPEPAGAPFLPQSGYRGPRESYFFREGSLGPGYYRKDVVRRYAGAASVPGESGAAPASASTTQEQMRAHLRRVARAPPGLRCAAVSADRRLLFTPSPDASGGEVVAWQLEAGEKGLSAVRVAELQGHSGGVLALVLTPDASLLISGSYDRTIRVWSTADWRCLRVLRGHGGGVRALGLSPDGRVLYSAAADNTIRAWSVQRWVCLRTLHGRHEDTTWPCCMALHPSAGGRGPRPLLATGSTGPFGASTLKAFNPGDGGCLATFAQLGYEQRGDVSTLAFSPDGSVLYSGASDGTVAAWSLRWGEHGCANALGLRSGFI